VRGKKRVWTVGNYPSYHLCLIKHLYGLDLKTVVMIVSERQLWNTEPFQQLVLLEDGFSSEMRRKLPYPQSGI
jgi:hypothetical protein